MIYNSIKSFILKAPSGTIWHFYLSDEQRIMYTCMEDQNLNQPSAMNLQPVKDFEATIDPDGTIHLLVLTQGHQLVYYRWDGLKWQHQMVEYNRYRIQYIPYFAILASHNQTHIIYCIKSQSRRSSETIMHYVGKKNEWNGGRIWVFAPERSTRLHSAFVDCDARIHLLFSQKKASEYLLHYSLFNPNSLIWSEPVNIYSCGYCYPDCYLYADRDGQIHIIWKEQDNDEHSIKYLSITGASAPSVEFQPARTLYKGRTEPVHPTLIFTDSLYCLWEMKGDIYYIVSRDMGNTWSKPQAFPNSTSRSPTFYNFTAFDKPDLPPTLRLWGMDYQEIPCIIEVQQATGKPDLKDTSDPKNTSYLVNKEQQEMIQKSLNNLEKRVKAAERQFESIIPTVYALQDQLQQTNKSIYYMEAMIRKLNFQIEQLRNRSSVYASGTEIRHERVRTASDKQIVSEKGQSPVPHDIQKIDEHNPSSTQNTDTTKPVEMPGTVSPVQDTHRTHRNESQPQEKTSQQMKDKKGVGQQPQDKPEEIKAPQTAGSLMNETQTQSADTSPDDGHTKRITIGNVDILINPEEDDI